MSSATASTEGRTASTLRQASAGKAARYSLAIVRQPEQGNGEAQEAARDLLEDFEPSLLLVVGLAGGPSRVLEAAGSDRMRFLPEADAKLHASPTLGPGESARGVGDRIETRIFTLRYESAVQLLPVLRPLIAPNNTITAYQNSNTLVITESTTLKPSTRRLIVAGALVLR